jgi:hypothetical protein
MNIKGSLAVLLASLVVLVGVARVAGNGEVQRELLARVVAVDQQAGSFEIERQFRGKTWRLTLKLTPETLIFNCTQKEATLAELHAGDLVSVYYAPIGREGVVTLVVIEPKEEGKQ